MNRQQIIETKLQGKDPARRKVQLRPELLNMEEVMECAQGDRDLGWCLACGAERSCVEPDARGYECESCGARAVFGCEEILIRWAF